MNSNEASRKEQARALLREAAAPLEFVELEIGALFECQICFAVVHRQSRVMHVDWHDQVHEGLADLGKLLRR